MPGKRKPIIVTVSDEALKDIDKLAEELGSKGMKVERVMPITGVVSGSVAPSKLRALSKLRGVSSVEEEQAGELRDSHTGD